MMDLSMLGQMAKTMVRTETLASSFKVLAEKAQNLAEKAQNAEEKYHSTEASSTDPLETQRDQAIRRITTIRNGAALCICDVELQQKIWCLLMEQTITTYEATTKRALEMVSVNVGQIETVLASYAHTQAYRGKVRLRAVLVSSVALAGIGGFLYIAGLHNMPLETTLPVLRIPVCVLLWSIVVIDPVVDPAVQTPEQRVHVG